MKVLRQRVSFAVALFVLVAAVWMLCASIAGADEWGTPDKQKHKIASAIGTEVLYVGLRANDVPYAAEWAAGTVVLGGVAKEYLFDPSRLNRYPARPSKKDMLANVIGAGMVYVGIKLGERFGVNPFYWEW